MGTVRSLQVFLPISGRFIYYFSSTNTFDLLLNFGFSFCGRGACLELQHYPVSEQCHNGHFPREWFFYVLQILVLHLPQKRRGPRGRTWRTGRWAGGAGTRTRAAPRPRPASARRNPPLGNCPSLAHPFLLLHVYLAATLTQHTSSHAHSAQSFKISFPLYSFGKNCSALW